MNTTYANRSLIEIPTEADSLVRQAKSGDASAFAQLYDICVEHVYRYIYFRVTNDIVAENVTVQVFFKAWEQLDHYKPSGSPFISWLYAIARNQIIVYYQTHKKTISELNKSILLDRDSDLSEEVRDMFDMQALRDSLQFLTEEEQQILILKFIVGLPTKNIARIMAKREGDILVLQIRALQTLARYLEEKAIL